MNLLVDLELSYSGFSKSQQKIARYVRENVQDILFLPLTELALKIETSPATLVRFARALGYEGYPDMQKAFQAQVTAQAGQPQADMPFDSQCERACESLAQMYRQLDSGRLARVGELLMSAPNVLIIGYMDSFGTAAELFHRMHCFREGMHFSRLIIDWNDMLKLMSRDTLVLAVSFEPHYQYTLTCVEEAKARGCQVLVLTDNPLNPFSALADETLVFSLIKRRGRSKLGCLDLSPVSGFIQRLTEYIEENYADALLDPMRHDEAFVE